MDSYRVTLRALAAATLRNLPHLPGQLRAIPVVLRADPDARLSIGAMVEQAARRFTHRPALLHEDEVLSWRQLNRRANRLAFALAERGVRSGQTVALLAGNSPAFLVCVVALAKLGAVAALLNTGERGTGLAHGFAISGASRLLLERDLEEAWSSAATDAEVWPLDDLEASADNAPAWDPPSTGQVRLGDPAFTIGTSGTTGLPKASVMTHMRWVKASAVYGHALLRLRPEDVVYVALPLFHNLALTSCWAGCCRTGAALAIGRRFSASGFWADCRRYGATAIGYIGEVPRYLLSQPPGPGDRDHGVTRAVGVGMRPELWTPFQQRFGVDRILEHYGASEGNTLFVNPLAVPRTVGFTISPHRLVAWDADSGELVRDRRGRPVQVGRGEPGLLLSKVTRRYSYDGYTDAGASEARLLRDPFGRGGTWFDSGDLLRKTGWFHAAFVDRVGDTFRWRSENVSVGQVEAVLGLHPQVADCAVYGVQVPGLPGRAGMAALVPSGELELSVLLERLRRDLSDAAVPVFLRLRSELETTGTHKHRKGRLKEQGFDPSCGEPLLVRLSGRGYVPLTVELHDRIVAGKERL